MHLAAVIVLVVLTLWSVWRDGVEWFAVWYSGGDAAFPARAKVWLVVRAILGLAAAVTAIATLPQVS